MAVDAIDAQIQGLISKAKLEANSKAQEHDSADVARKAAEKKLEIKKASIKGSLVDRETFTRNKNNQAKLAQVLGGVHGQEAADALRGFENNAQLQNKLTEAQRNQFREAMAQNPRSAAKAGQALNRLAQSETFQKSVNTSQQAGLIQDSILRNPGAERDVNRMLGNRFMQSPKADNQAKSSLLRFGLQKKGSGVGLDRTLDMMGSLAKHDVGRSGQRASMNMAHRNAGNASAMEGVDQFIQQPAIHKMPMPAKTKATEIMARANGNADVADGLTQIAQDPKFKTQTAANKGRIFATIGTGRPSEFRQLADKNLKALRSANFPTRSAHVGRFLGKLSARVSAAGAEGVDVDDLMKSAKQSPLPSAPVLMSEEGLSEEDAQKVRRQNRAKVIQFFTKVSRSYDQSEKQLNSAKYFEDINRMTNLREPEELDLTMLSPEDKQFVQDKKAKLSERLGDLRQTHRQRSRELRTKRMPMAKRRAKAAQARAKGAQPRYFNPHVDRHTPPSQAFLAPVEGNDYDGGMDQAGLPQTPQHARRGRTAPRARAGRGASGGSDIKQQVSAALSQLGDGPVTPDMAAQVAQSIASQVAQQVAKQVTEEVMKNFAAVGMADPDAVQDGEDLSAHKKRQALKNESTSAQARKADGETGRTGRSMARSAAPTDGWGIQRNFSPELGGAQREVVKAPIGQDEYAPAPTLNEAEAAEAYTGKMLVKDASQVRPMATLMAANWKTLSRAEQALLKNLGWNQQTWDTKDTPSAKWPASMATVFMSLSPLQRESLKKLGFTPHEWDKRIQAFTMGKNA